MKDPNNANVFIDTTSEDEDDTDEYVATTEGEDCGYSDDLGYWVECSEGLYCEQ